MSELIDFLPLLGDREAIILGQGTAMPMRIRFDDVGKGRATDSTNIAGFSKSWQSENLTREMLDAIVSRWRNSGRDKT